jgi:hypothetical protein
MSLDVVGVLTRLAGSIAIVAALRRLLGGR